MDKIIYLGVLDLKKVRKAIIPAADWGQGFTGNKGNAERNVTNC